MIVIEAVGVQVPLQERPRYPGKIMLPILVPPSPEASERAPPPEKKSSLWLFALIGGVVGLIGSSGAKTPHLGEAKRQSPYPKERPTNRLYYMWRPPGKWYQDAVSIPKSKLRQYQEKAMTTPGSLYYIWAESADRARYSLRTDPATRHTIGKGARYYPEERKPTAKQEPAEQLTLFSGRTVETYEDVDTGTRWNVDKTTKKTVKRGYAKGVHYLATSDAGLKFWMSARELRGRGLRKISTGARPSEAPQLTLFSGRIANCAIWIEDGKHGWKCGAYGRVCDSATCAEPPDPTIKQTKVCVTTQKVFSGFYDRLITRCKRYEATCEGPACMEFTMPYPEAPERRQPTKAEIRSIAEWIAEQYNRETFEKEPIIAREILSRGGIAPPRVPTALEKPKRVPEEYTAIPLFLRNRQGLPMDEMAAEMGYDYFDEVMAQIQKAYPPKEKGAWRKLRRKTYRDFEDEAKFEIEERIYEGTWQGLLGGSPARVWQSTLQEFTALQREKDDPSLPSQLNWILERTRVNPEGYMRVFRGNLPGHMKKKLQDWLFMRHNEPGKWLEDKRITIDMNPGRKSTDYIVKHPFYTVVVRFWKDGSVLVTEDRGNYHADSLRTAIAQGKAVPRKVLTEYAPYMPEAKQALGIGSLGQDLFPGLRRELKLEPAHDPATSDDPVIACMQRLGWTILRMDELKASISEKLTPDLFTGKIKRLSTGEKEYQRVIGECLAARSGTAGALRREN